MDLGLLDGAPFLEYQFACLLNVLTSCFGVSLKLLVELSVSRCTYARDVFLENEALWARVLPEVFDRGQENPEWWVASEENARLNGLTHFSG